jgi:hypothetical protein
MLGGKRLHNIIEELNEITKKLYRLEIREAIIKWKEILEQISVIIEEQGENKEDVLRILQIIALAIQNRDYILMADLIRYELIILLNKS